MQEISGKVAVVTGGASGIGLALARRFGADGAKVVIGDVQQDALDAAVAELTSSGIEAIGVLGDVTVAEQVDALAAAAVDTFGGVHIACLNAGVGGGGLSWETPVETWEWVLGVNLWGVIHGVRTFVPLTMQQPEGHIVITASVAGLVGTPFMGPYNASKHAAVAIAETLFHELALMNSGTHVSVLCPGWVNTKIGESERNRPAHLTPEETEEQAQQRLMGVDVLKAFLENGMSPDDVAAQVLEAIHAERFWVLTHHAEDMWMQAVRNRVESTIAGTNPPLNLLA